MWLWIWGVLDGDSKIFNSKMTSAGKVKSEMRLMAGAYLAETDTDTDTARVGASWK